ncbi:hypothetical protein HDU96_008661 [Phlyctochytrium bullatum]|nr:hypothetical protein HDU96_008661 [Phlyctochytrium bullatum]
MELLKIARERKVDNAIKLKKAELVQVLTLQTLSREESRSRPTSSSRDENEADEEQQEEDALSSSQSRNLRSRTRGERDALQIDQERSEEAHVADEDLLAKLEQRNRAELAKMAQEHKVRYYYNLKKADLIQALVPLLTMAQEDDMTGKLESGQQSDDSSIALTTWPRRGGRGATLSHVGVRNEDHEKDMTHEQHAQIAASAEKVNLANGNADGVGRATRSITRRKPQPDEVSVERVSSPSQKNSRNAKKMDGVAFDDKLTATEDPISIKSFYNSSRNTSPRLNFVASGSPPEVVSGRKVHGKAAPSPSGVALERGSGSKVTKPAASTPPALLKSSNESGASPSAVGERSLRKRKLESEETHTTSEVHSLSKRSRVATARSMDTFPLGQPTSKDSADEDILEDIPDIVEEDENSMSRPQIRNVRESAPSVQDPPPQTRRGGRRKTESVLQKDNTTLTGVEKRGRIYRNRRVATDESTEEISIEALSRQLNYDAHMLSGTLTNDGSQPPNSQIDVEPSMDSANTENETSSVAVEEQPQMADVVHDTGVNPEDVVIADSLDIAIADSLDNTIRFGDDMQSTEDVSDDEFEIAMETLPDINAAASESLSSPRNAGSVPNLRRESEGAAGYNETDGLSVPDNECPQPLSNVDASRDLDEIGLPVQIEVVQQPHAGRASLNVHSVAVESTPRNSVGPEADETLLKATQNASSGRRADDPLRLSLNAISTGASFDSRFSLLKAATALFHKPSGRGGRATIATSTLMKELRNQVRNTAAQTSGMKSLDSVAARTFYDSSSSPVHKSDRQSFAADSHEHPVDREISFPEPRKCSPISAKRPETYDDVEMPSASSNNNPANVTSQDLAVSHSEPTDLPIEKPNASFDTAEEPGTPGARRTSFKAMNDTLKEKAETSTANFESEASYILEETLKHRKSGLWFSENDGTGITSSSAVEEIVPDSLEYLHNSFSLGPARLLNNFAEPNSIVDEVEVEDMEMRSSAGVRFTEDQGGKSSTIPKDQVEGVDENRPTSLRELAPEQNVHESPGAESFEVYLHLESSPSIRGEQRQDRPDQFERSPSFDRITLSIPSYPEDIAASSPSEVENESDIEKEGQPEGLVIVSQPVFEHECNNVVEESDQEVVPDSLAEEANPLVAYRPITANAMPAISDITHEAVSRKMLSERGALTAPRGFQNTEIVSMNLSRTGQYEESNLMHLPDSPDGLAASENSEEMATVSGSENDLQTKSDALNEQEAVSQIEVLSAAATGTAVEDQIMTVDFARKTTTAGDDTDDFLNYAPSTKCLPESVEDFEHVSP